MNYFEVLSDEPVVEQFEKIDSHSGELSHGRQHAVGVMENMIKLSGLLEIKDEELNYLMVACVLHDMGQLEGSDNHYIRSAEFARTYLAGKVPEEWYERIVRAIELHHAKDVKEMPMFEHLLLFADKMDFSNRRLNKVEDGQSKEFTRHILDINFDMKDDVFWVLINADDEVGIEEFNSWSHWPKITKRVEEFADKLGMDYAIKIFGKESLTYFVEPETRTPVFMNLIRRDKK